MIKKPLRRFIFFPVFLIVIFCFNDLAHAVALDDGGGKGKAASLLKTRSATKVTIQNNQATSKKPEYVPNEVIVKLKAKATPNVLYSMAYSQRQSMDVNTLSNLKARYGLRDERPAFKHLHEQLKSANMSQALLD